MRWWIVWTLFFDGNELHQPSNLFGFGAADYRSYHLSHTELAKILGALIFHALELGCWEGCFLTR